MYDLGGLEFADKFTLNNLFDVPAFQRINKYCDILCLLFLDKLRHVLGNCFKLSSDSQASCMQETRCSSHELVLLFRDIIGGYFGCGP